MARLAPRKFSVPSFDHTESVFSRNKTGSYWIQYLQLLKQYMNTKFDISPLNPGPVSSKEPRSLSTAYVWNFKKREQFW